MELDTDDLAESENEFFPAMCLKPYTVDVGVPALVPGGHTVVLDGAAAFLEEVCNQACRVLLIELQEKRLLLATALTECCTFRFSGHLGQR